MAREAIDLIKKAEKEATDIVENSHIEAEKLIETTKQECEKMLFDLEGELKKEYDEKVKKANEDAMKISAEAEKIENSEALKLKERLFSKKDECIKLVIDKALGI